MAPARLHANSTLTYQGQLFGAHGAINATYDMTFRLYADAEGGAPIWSEAYDGVPVVDGVFLVELGAQNPFGDVVQQDGPLYLGIALGENEEMSPRMLVGTALRAQWASHARDVEGEDIHPKTISIGQRLVIDENGNWRGEAIGIQGPEGPAGPPGADGRSFEASADVDQDGFADWLESLAGSDPLDAASKPVDENQDGVPDVLVGARGQIGPIGPQGPQGATGPQGQTGERGAMGAQGPQGPQGQTGLQGPVGEAGPQGMTGAQGPQGLQGQKGDTGAMGPVGPIGPAGPVGEKGPKGDVGSEGPQGVAGPRGLQGLEGPMGPMGPQGARGYTGDTGDKGEKGDTGDTGLPGPPGERGLTGPRGEQGEAGPIGPQGQRGPQGETGPAGPLGPQGARGLQGEPGERGPMGLEGQRGPIGETGPMGPVGQRGPEGAKGDKGDVGLMGPAGPKGEKGDSGPIGPQGLQGAQGLTGATGPRGEKGDPGPTGAQGVQGPQGLMGATGPRGDEGPKGDKGDTGVVGPAGPTGSTGPKGDRGEKGDRGDPGPAGPTGPTGDVGPPGAQGPRGEKGDRGDVGPQGPMGQTGDTGSQGPRGEKGDRGDPGPQGATGDTGPQGPQGPSGPSGVAGPQGQAGATGPQGIQGIQGIQGQKGDRGDAGEDGLTTLIKLTQVAETVQCLAGGQRIDYGLDADRDGNLDAGEVTGSQYVCHGSGDGSSGGGGSSGGDGYTSLAELTTLSPGTLCPAGGQRLDIGVDLNRDNNLDLGEISSSEAICNGETGAQGAAGPKGDAGADGPTGADGNTGPKGDTGDSGYTTLTQIISEGAGANCVNGGQLIRSGLDGNRNNLLDANEYTTNQYICHGTTGAQGERGADGATGPQGDEGPQGPMGPIGPQGERGLTSLMVLLHEPAGDNCATGGKLLRYGRDANGDGALSEGEWEGTQYVCNGSQGPAGAQGVIGDRGPIGLTGDPGTKGDKGDKGDSGDKGATGDTGPRGEVGPSGPAGATGAAGFTTLMRVIDEPAGLNCVNGGKLVHVGRDADRDGLLSATEVESGNFVCNGAQGIQGPQGDTGSKGDKGDKGDTGDPGPKGDTGLKGDQGDKGDTGDTGARGHDGFSTLIKTTAEASGTNCPSGGERIEIGKDDDSDGILSPTEIDMTRFVCNGIQGEQGIQGEKGDPASARSEAEVETFIVNGPLNLASGTTLNSKSIVTQNAPCQDGELLLYDLANAAWVCGEDSDTTLSAAQVKSIIEQSVVNLSAGSSVSGQAILHQGSTLPVANLSREGVSDGDILQVQGSDVRWTSAPVGLDRFDCATGEHVGYTSNGWECVPIQFNAAAPLAFSNGNLTFDENAVRTNIQNDFDTRYARVDSGAGDISFAGAIQAGSTTAICDANSGQRGSIRWNAGSDQLEVCSSVGWRVLRQGADGSSAYQAARNCFRLHQNYPSLPDGVYWIQPPGLDAFQAYCDMTHNGGGWTLVLAAGLGYDLVTESSRGQFEPLPVSAARPPDNTVYKMSDDLINAVRSSDLAGDEIGYWVTTPGSGTGTLGAEIFHRVDCVFKMFQTSSEVKATTCHQSTITFSDTPSWMSGGHWWDDNGAYKWAFGYAAEGDHGTGQTCYATGRGLGSHTPSLAPFHRGWCSNADWGQVWVR